MSPEQDPIRAAVARRRAEKMTALPGEEEPTGPEGEGAEGTGPPRVHAGAGTGDPPAGVPEDPIRAAVRAARTRYEQP
jgi:hypothetical protein